MLGYSSISLGTLGDDDDEYGESAVHESMEEKFDRVFDDIADILVNVPPTWTQYVGKPGGHMAIVKMEVDECMNAYQGMKMNTVTHKDFTHELLHAMAAMAAAYEAMTCDSYKE